MTLILKYCRINTIYLSIFTLIYSSSIQYNEIIEGLSLGRNIRFNPGLLMVSKRRGGKASGKKKTKMAENLKSWKTKEEFNVLFIYSYPRCTLLLKSLDKRTRWQIVHHTDLSVTIISVSLHYTRTFCQLASQKEGMITYTTPSVSSIGLALRVKLMQICMLYRVVQAHCSLHSVELNKWLYIWSTHWAVQPVS